MSPGVLTEPSQFFAEIDAQPPLMRANVANTYVGKEVDWNLFFVDGSEPIAGTASLIFHSGVMVVWIISGEVSLIEHPYLRSLPAGEPVRVRGKIKKIDALSINLDISELTLAKIAEAAH